MPAGQALKSLRNKRNVTVREVEQASRRIADVKGDKRFCISNGWLAQLENGVSEPSICKLFSLSVIYHANFLDLVRLYNVDVAEKEKYEPVAHPHLTQLVADQSNGNGNGNGLNLLPPVTTSLISDRLVTSSPQLTHGEECSPGIIYAHLGSSEFTLYPIIRPGALLKIDTNQNKPTTGIWHNEYDRPIFLIELRGGYTCGWCELQGNQLLIIPHPSSPANVRRFTYPREAEIVGRVVWYSTNCVDVESRSEQVQKIKRGR